MECNFQGKGFFRAWNRHREIAHQLADIASVTEQDLRADQACRLADDGLGAVEEFDAMLARVGLDNKAAPLNAKERVDLYLHCTECCTRTACRMWLENGADRFGYRSFCPNALMFERLKSINIWRGRGLKRS